MRITKPITIRRAKAADAEQVRDLQGAAFRIKNRAVYGPSEIESYLGHAGTLNSGLIAEGTFFVAEIEGEIVAAGGWSIRAAGYANFISSSAVAPAGSATIHGVYADPCFAATGLAQRVLAAIEADIASCGHTTIHVATTYTGMPFFTSAAYAPSSLLSLACPNGEELHGVVMTKNIAKTCALAA